MSGFEHSTVRRLTLPTSRGNRVAREILGQEHDPTLAKKRPTVLDFQGLPEGSTDQEIVSWVSFATGIPESVLLGGSKNASEVEKKESQRVYALLRESFAEGKKYLHTALHYGDKDLKVEMQPDSIHDATSLIQFLKKTQLVKSQKNFGKGVLYCRLTKAALIAYHALRAEGKSLSAEVRYLEKKILHQRGSEDMGERKVVPLSEIHSGDGKYFFVTNSSPQITGIMFARGKGFESQMTKYITRPDSSIETAQKDGIGMMFEIDEDKALEFLPLLCTWLGDDLGVTQIMIENSSFYGNKDAVHVLKERMKQFQISGLAHFGKPSREGGNTTTSGDYRALKLSGYVGVPLGGQDGGQIIKRRFEIQIVPKDNEHQKIRIHHDVYDVVKKVTARTRLDGSCPYQAFENFCREAARKSGFELESVINVLLGDPRLVQVARKNRIIAKGVYDRWLSIGWVDDDLYADLIRPRK